MLLLELQQAFAQQVFATAEGGLDIRANGLTEAKRLQIYRNNVFSSLTEALRAIYPVLGRLVGDIFFKHAAYQYIRGTPSASGNLHDFGASFADFLAVFPGAKELVYLPDVARLEWGYHRVFHAAGASALDPTRLSPVAIEEHGAIKFKLHPACYLLASDHPILRIWQVNQEDYQGDQHVNLDDGGVKALIFRRELDITVRALSAGEFVFLKAIGEGREFADVCDVALAAEPSIDLATYLQQQVASGMLVDFAL